MHATRALMNKPNKSDEQRRKEEESDSVQATMRQTTSSQLTSNANRRSEHRGGERGAHEEMQSNTQRIWHVYTKTHCKLHTL